MTDRPSRNAIRGTDSPTYTPRHSTRPRTPYACTRRSHNDDAVGSRYAATRVPSMSRIFPDRAAAPAPIVLRHRQIDRARGSRDSPCSQSDSPTRRRGSLFGRIEQIAPRIRAAGYAVGGHHARPGFPNVMPLPQTRFAANCRAAVSPM